MKSNKVLLGLFVGVLALIGGSVTAQTKFHEIGPANVAGHVSSIVVDQRDTNHTTVFAGSISGGLFMRSDNEELLSQLYTNAGLDASLASNHNTWHLVPCQTVLPITCMTQAPDNTLIIGTGDNTYQVGSSFGRMSVLGKGIYRYNPNDGSLTMVPGTKPTSIDADFAAVKDIKCLQYNGKLYVFAVTGTGIYRWVISGSGDWNTAPTKVFNGEVGDFLLVSARRVAYFSAGNQLYKFGNVTATTMSPAVNISTTNSAFAAPNIGIKLAVAPSDPSYLYAMVIDENGLMEALYLTTNEQTWSTLTTATIRPLTTNTGETCGAMVVDPGNPKRIYIAGSTIWAGEGYVDGSYFQWTKSSYSESELNYGDYMASVFTSLMYVHSGIHQIVPTYALEEDGYRRMVYYIATDGGVFTTNAFNYYQNTNIGLNSVQINDLAVCPDGSVISGAVSNSSLMIESRLDHDSVATTPVWYDASNHGFNHDANVIFSAEGGKVAASMFQQVKPASRRLIMVSNDEGNYGRTYDDYLDYTNTQTWTQASAFVSNTNYNETPGVSQRFYNTLGNIYLWETNKNTVYKDSVHANIDTLGYVLRKRSGSQVYDTVWMSLEGMTTGGVFVRNEEGEIIDTTAVGTGHGSTFQILSGDKIMINSRANSDYPFEYTFTRNQKAGEKVVAKNPLQSRALIVARDSTNPAWWTVQLSLRATDFTKVWDATMAYDLDAYDWSSVCLWYPIFQIRTDMGSSLRPHSEEGLRPRGLAMSADGTKVFIAVQDILTKESMIVRINGFENINYYINNGSAITRAEGYTRLKNQLSCRRLASTSMIYEDTLRVDGSEWIPRSISSIKIDTVSGTERLLVTFEDYDNDFANFAIVNNCKDASWSLTEMPVSGHASEPAYCAMVEKTTGDIYVGTSEGVFFRHGSTWAPYEALQGIPVTAMTQQQNKLPVVHSLSHNGITPVNYAFARTKWTNAMYFGTYGRGIFMDKQYVDDSDTNEVVDRNDYLDIPTVRTTMGSVSVYPNPVCGEAHLAITSEIAANGTVRIYDLNGRCVAVRELGTIAEGESTYTISTEGLTKGMYLVNVIIGGYTSATKMMVR